MGTMMSFIIWFILTFGTIIILGRNKNKTIVSLRYWIGLILSVIYWFSPLHTFVKIFWLPALIVFVITFFYKPFKLK